MAIFQIWLFSWLFLKIAKKCSILAKKCLNFARKWAVLIIIGSKNFKTRVRPQFLLIKICQFLAINLAIFAKIPIWLFLAIEIPRFGYLASQTPGSPAGCCCTSLSELCLGLMMTLCRPIPIVKGGSANTNLDHAISHNIITCSI